MATTPRGSRRRAPECSDNYEQSKAEAEFYKRKCEEYEESLIRLRRREAALVHRLVLAESTQFEAASRLGGAIEEDVEREMDALEELQEKISELEECELRKAQALKDFAVDLRIQNDLVRSEYSNGIRDIEVEVRHSMMSILSHNMQQVRNELNTVRDDIWNEIQDVLQNTGADVEAIMTSESTISRERVDRCLRALSTALQLELDPALFWGAVRPDVLNEEAEVFVNRFIASASSPRIKLLENALEQSQKAEARAKKIALKVAAKRDEEVEAERGRVAQLSRKLEQASAALEKAKGDFDSLSLVVDELTRNNQG